MRKLLIQFLLLMLTGITATGATIGTWNAYMAYYDVTEIERAGNIIYVLASKGLYAYDTEDGSIQTYDKINYLNDCSIAHIAWCQGAKRLMIVYDNQNIDFIDRDNHVYNLSDYYYKAMMEDKSINDIYMYGKYAYLSTGFGVMKVNVADAEISDTYNLGFKVDYCYIENNRIYAASRAQGGTYSASLTDNLLDKSYWKQTSNYTPRNKTIDPELLALVKTLQPGGPKYNNFHFMKLKDGFLYTCGGFFATGKADTYAPGTIQVLNTNSQTWQMYQDQLDTITGVRYIDINSLDIDPTEKNHVRLFASGRTGVYEFVDGRFKKWYYKGNSLLEPAMEGTTQLNDNYTLVHSLLFDQEGNLWLLNSQSKNQNIVKMTADGKWESYFKKPLVFMDAFSMPVMVGLIEDSRQLMWFCDNYWSAPLLACYDYRNDRITVYTNFVNQDGTIVSVQDGVRCVQEDKDGNMWIGTSAGLLELLATDIGKGSDVSFTQVKVPRNDGTNYADYLLDGVPVTAIAIDKANRKWIGTEGDGVYLIGSDNITTIAHFTTENSDLLSDNISSIVINHQSGEVFFGSETGLCSYMSDATEESEKMTKETVYAYPNPVRPDYNGLITIVGLTYNADVKIVNVNGTLVAQGRSNGGTFTWDGCDRNGKRVASGIYMVQTATEEGKKGTVCKIAIVR